MEAAVETPAVAPELRRYEDLPGPRSLPFVGNVLQIDPPRFHLQLEQWAKEYGPLYRLKFNQRLALVVGDHEVVASVLRDRPEGFERSRKMQEIWAELGMPIGVFGANGDTWARQRRMVMAGFDPAHVKRYFPAMLKVADRLTGRWQRAAAQAQAIPLQSDLMRYTVDTIAGLAFGDDVNTLESDEHVIQRHLDRIFPAIGKRVVAPVALWRWHKSRSDRELDASVVAVNAAVTGFIDKARARMAADPGLREHPRNLLEAMLAAADQPGSGLDDAQVAGNVVTMLLAGEDTTANTLAWMIHLLWRNPQALAQAKAEVRAALEPSGEITLERLASLDFVEACMQETMRLKPVAPMLPLQALKDLTVGGVAIPARTVVICLLRRDSISEAHFERADEFRPERWLGEREANAAPLTAAKRTVMPFGAGPRTCPGRYLALLEMKLAIATLLGRFDIEAVDTPDGEEAREHLAVTMAPEGLTMRLSMRQ